MSTELVVHDLTREKVELIKQTVAKGATDLELDLFLHACKRTGLDPLMKQIYAIKRWNSAEKKEVLSFQTGIDGYRLIADRTGKYAGSDEPTYEIGSDGFPDVASVTVTKLVDGVPCKFAAAARWNEYVQTTKEGQPTSMWKKMPFLMLGKCAEALALRKAFPAELSGVYTHEEMMQADTEPRITVMDAKREASQKIAELKQEFDHGQRETGQGALADALPSASTDSLDASAALSAVAFVWRIGKYKGENIVTIPDDYLDWFAQNGTNQDHREAAANELDRRRGQGSMA